MGLVRRFRSLFGSGTVLTCVNIKSVEPKEKKRMKKEKEIKEMLQ